jgi:predicted AlkP superfamily pyrophosphatase or phosphodiesterase
VLNLGVLKYTENPMWKKITKKGRIAVLEMGMSIIFLSVFSFTTAQVSAQASPEKPKLVIGIIIDQMRYDFIYKYWNKYSNNGFKRLINEGSFCKNANFNYLLTFSNSGFATISTGANPSVHGIVSDEWYVPLLDKTVHCTRDDNVQTIGGNDESEKHSPVNLIASTIGDEIKLSTYKMAKVISVSIDPSAAVLNAGHLADAAYWFDTYSENWVTSSCYLKELPDWVKQFNQEKLADTYLNRKWETFLPDSLYRESLSDKNPYEIGFNGLNTFPYDLNSLSTGEKGIRNYKILKYTPFGNSFTKDFAISAIVNENLGKGEFTDYICIDFSSTEYICQLFGLSSMEMEDAYLRLDKEIEHFLNFLDGYIGKGNVLVYLTSNHGSAYSAKLMNDIGVPSGLFNQGQAISLLKSYLNVVYGKADWVKYYCNQQIFLNRNLIQDSKLSLENFQVDVAQFMLQFSGVTNAATSTMFQKNYYTGGAFEKMQNSFNQKRSGDIIISLEPGWTERNDLSSAHNSGYNYDTHVPLIFYGWKINSQTIYEPVDMTDIAPTISTILDIAFPNSVTGKPIIQIIK